MNSKRLRCNCLDQWSLKFEAERSLKYRKRYWQNPLIPNTLICLISSFSTVLPKDSAKSEVTTRHVSLMVSTVDQAEYFILTYRLNKHYCWLKWFVQCNFVRVIVQCRRTFQIKRNKKHTDSYTACAFCPLVISLRSVCRTISNRS